MELKNNSLIEFETLKSEITLLTNANDDLIEDNKKLNYEA